RRGRILRARDGEAARHERARTEQRAAAGPRAPAGPAALPPDRVGALGPRDGRRPRRRAALRRGARAPRLRGPRRDRPRRGAVLLPAAPGLVRRSRRVPARQRQARRARRAPVRSRSRQPAARVRHLPSGPGRAALPSARARRAARGGGARRRGRPLGPPGAVRGLRVADEFSAVAPFQRGRDQHEGGPMKIGTEQEWQAARKELLAAERELEEHAERVEAQRREVPWVSAYRSDFLFDYGYAFRSEEMSGVVREEFDMGQLLREAPQWLRDYREQVGAPDLESAVSVSAGWSVFARRDGAAYNTYRV